MSDLDVNNSCGSCGSNKRSSGEYREIHTGRTHRDRRAGSGGSRRRSSSSLKEKVTEIRYRNKQQESTYQRSAGYEE